jgi:hypothetical protein
MKPLKILIVGAVLALLPLLVWRGLRAPKPPGLSGPASGANRKSARSSAGTPADGSSSVASLRKLLEGGEPPKLSAEQLRAFVETQKHSAASLLAAWHLGADTAWLDEAAKLHPDDPRVALAKLSTLDATSGDANEWIQRLKQADPENAMGWCYEALSAFKGGSPDEARAALAEAAQRGRFDVYTKESAAELTKAYRSAGVDGLEAEMLGLFGVSIPQAQLAMNVQREAISQLGGNLDDELVQDMLKLSKAVRGDEDPGFLITQLVGSSMERKLLAELNTLDLIPGTRTFVLERLGDLDSEKNLVRSLVQKTVPLMPALSESELRQYFKRTTVEGELKAMQWLLARHPEAR